MDESDLRPVLGILGGMGPLATADFFTKLIDCTEARTESDNIRTVIWSDPTIPDRTQALLGKGPSPVPAMIENTRALVDFGVSLLAMPCNTAHAFLDEVVAATDARFINMIDVTIEHCVDAFPGASHIGVLSTAGTTLSGLYRRATAARGLSIVEPTETEQGTLVSPAIQTVKSGGDFDGARASIRRAADTLVSRGAEVVVAACTELPLIISGDIDGVPIVDATYCLAEATVRTVQAGLLSPSSQ